MQKNSYNVDKESWEALSQKEQYETTLALRKLGITNIILTTKEKEKEDRKNAAFKKECQKLGRRNLPHAKPYTLRILYTCRLCGAHFQHDISMIQSPSDPTTLVRSHTAPPPNTIPDVIEEHFTRTCHNCPSRLSYFSKESLIKATMFLSYKVEDPKHAMTPIAPLLSEKENEQKEEKEGN